MALFDSGVKGYVRAKATVKVSFPVDWKDNADICCYQCDFFNRNNGVCQLTKKVSEYPHKHIGSHCPLEEFIEEVNKNEF